MPLPTFGTAGAASPTLAPATDRPRCRTCVFKHECLPAELEGAELAVFERAVSRQVRPIREGQVLVRQGNAMNGLYTLRVGALKAVIDTADGSERVVGFRFPGAVIGLAEPEHDGWARTFIALEDSWLCRIPLEAIDGTVHRQLVRLMSQRLRREYTFHLALAFRTSAEKVIEFLLDISESHRHRRLAADRFTLPMSFIEIASYLGMRHESVSRTLSDLQRRGLIAHEGRRFAIPSLEALRAF